MKRALARTYLLLAAIAAASGAQAQDFSVKPVRIIVPWTPGGNIDITARALAPGLGAALGTTVIIENKPGAGGTIGTAQAASAPPDGHTLTVGSSATITIAPSIYKGVTYDPLKDFVAIGSIHTVPMVLSVAITTPAKTFAEFVALAKSRNGQLSIANSGVGSTNHLTVELLARRAGITMVQIPYKGSGPALNDLVAGQVEATVDQMSSSLPHIQEGRIRALAVATRQRIAVLPEVPTFDELGLKGFEASTFTGLFGPSAMPPAVRDKLAAALATTLADPGVRQRFKSLGADLMAMDRDQFTTFVAEDFAKWRRVVQEANITAE